MSSKRPTIFRAPLIVTRYWFCALTEKRGEVCVSEPGAVAMGSNTQVEFMIGSLPLAVLTQRCARTAELTRRRASKHPSPYQTSCERRHCRSRPTICYGRRVGQYLRLRGRLMLRTGG